MLNYSLCLNLERKGLKRMKASDCIHYYVVEKDGLFYSHGSMFTMSQEAAYAFTNEEAAAQLAREHDASVQHLSVSYGELENLPLAPEDCIELDFLEAVFY